MSRRWHEIFSDDQAWKTLGELVYGSPRSTSPTTIMEGMDPMTEDSDILADTSSPPPGLGFTRRNKRARPRSTHRSHFKHRYLVESAWRKGGQMTARHITPDQGVVTSLHLTKNYIIIGLDNAKIHVFNTKGVHQRTLQGHVMGVWAMVPWEDTLVSGGCDRDVRVWNMSTG